MLHTHAYAPSLLSQIDKALTTFSDHLLPSLDAPKV